MKKFLALLISLSVLLMCVPGISLVASAAEIDDETFLTLTKADFQTKDGTTTNAGKEANPYLITNTDEYRAVFDIKSTVFVNGNYVSGYFEIPADTDITLVYDAATSKGFIPNAAKPLSGGIEGNGNTITIQIGSSTNRFPMNGTNKFLAPIPASMRSSVKNLNSTGWIYATGGSSSYLIGGIVASATSASVIENCESNVFIDATGSDTVVGGIVGQVKAATVKNCVNNASVNAPSSARCGGIIGQISSGDPVTVIGCKNYGNSAVNGGIVGATAAAINMTACANYGNLSKHNAGGLVGSITSAATFTVTIDQCLNAGKFTYDTTAPGGAFIGRPLYAGGTNGTRDYTWVIRNSYNTAVANGSGEKPGSLIGNAAGTKSSTRVTTLNITVENCYDFGVSVRDLFQPDLRDVATTYTTTTYAANNNYVLGKSSLSTATGASSAFLKTIPENWSTEIWELPSAGYPYIQLKANKIDTTNANVAALVENNNVEVTRGTNFATLATAEDAIALANVKNASGVVTPITEGMAYAVVAARMPLMVGDFEYGIFLSEDATIANSLTEDTEDVRIVKAVRSDNKGNFAVLVYNAPAQTMSYRPYVKVNGVYYYGAGKTFNIPAPEVAE